MAAFLRFAALAAAALALAGCGRPTSDAPPAPGDDRRPIAPAENNAASASDAGPAAIGPDRLPERFFGLWDSSAAACDAGSSEMRLEIQADRLRFHESVARIQALRPAGEAVEVDLAFEGEGERWSETRTLRLLPGPRLIVEAGDSSAERMRCG